MHGPALADGIGLHAAWRPADSSAVTPTCMVWRGTPTGAAARSTRSAASSVDQPDARAELWPDDWPHDADAAVDDFGVVTGGAVLMESMVIAGGLFTPGSTLIEPTKPSLSVAEPLMAKATAVLLGIWNPKRSPGVITRTCGSTP